MGYAQQALERGTPSARVPAVEHVRTHLLYLEELNGLVLAHALVVQGVQHLPSPFARALDRGPEALDQALHHLQCWVACNTARRPRH